MSETNETNGVAGVIDVVSLYPKDMNIYGDSGNLTVARRLALYGYAPRIHEINQGDPWPEHVDMILGGGGQDTGQKKIIDDLFARADDLRRFAADGVPMLMICGLYQLFGHYFETIDGTRLDGIGIIGAHTIGRDVRMIGNLVEHSAHFGDIIGYENHSGQTFLDPGVEPLGRVDHDGTGNNGEHLHARFAAAQEPGHCGFPHPRGRGTALRRIRTAPGQGPGRRTRAHRRNRRQSQGRGRRQAAVSVPSESAVFPSPARVCFPIRDGLTPLCRFFDIVPRMLNRHEVRGAVEWNHIRSKEDTMADFDFGEGLRKVFLAGVGALATTVEKGQEIVDDLVKKGELTVEQGKALNTELKRKAEEVKEEHEAKADQAE